MLTQTLTIGVLSQLLQLYGSGLHRLPFLVEIYR